MPQPISHLIQILITVNPNGSFTAKVRSYFDGTVLHGPLFVNIGDQVGWLVAVAMPNGRKLLPYTLGFKDSADAPDESFFGVSSLNVATGGASPYLPVRSVQSSVKYTLNVTGVGCVFDPDIQSGDAPAPPESERASTAFVVYWDTVANSMTWSSSSNPQSVPFPPAGLRLSVGDKVTFEATVAAGNVTNFDMEFTDHGNGWVTPFEPNDRILAAAGNSKTIGPKTVSDTSDHGAEFPFTASIKVGGAPISFPGAPNVKFTL